MNLNLDSVKKNSYDAIVVGSGISGGWAAKELCEKGLKVLLLERGTNVDHPNYPTTTTQLWKFEHRGRLTQKDKEKYPIQTRHYSISEENKHFYINDLENPYLEEKRYDWIRADVLGGRSLLWGRQSYRWSDLDFEANARDGLGVDWPIRYKELVPWYEYVEKFVGISGQKESIPHLPDSIFQPAMEFTCVEQDFKKRMQARYPDRYVTIGRVANLTKSLKGRAQCQYRNLCHRGCLYGAYFSSNSSTLPAAAATGNLTLVTNALVNKVIYDEQKNRATGVEVIDTTTQQVTEYYARVLFLNASTLGTSFILLNSTSNRFPNGLGNGSDQVGRNLMDHHKGCGASTTVEGFEDKYYYGRRPNGIYIPRFRNTTDKHPEFIRGYGYQGWSSRGDWQRLTSGTLLGNALKSEATEPGGWQLGFSGYGECLPYSDNRVTLDHSQTDKWGRPVLKINCEFKENERAMSRDISNTMGEMLTELGYQNVRLQESISFPGNANHEMGTARMGNDPKTSVLNKHNQMHEVPNVYITDGSFMSSSGWVNPSLTYMAITARACQHAVDEMNRASL